MTERKPPGVSFETWIERQIREAQARGEFDNLPGAGRPIADLDRPHDDLWWVKEKLRRENVSLLPPALALRKEAADALAQAMEATSEATVREIVADINAKIRQGIRTPHTPPVNMMPFDMERVVDEWREKQRAEEQERAAAAVVEDVARVEPSPRSTRWFRRRRAH